MLLLYTLQVDIRTVFYVAFIPALAALAIISFVVEQRPPADNPNTSTLVRPSEFPRSYWRFLISVALFSIGNSSNSFLILRTQEAGASILMNTLVYAVFNLIATLVSYPLTHLSDKLGRKTVILGSFFVFLITHIGFAFTLNLVAIIVEGPGNLLPDIGTGMTFRQKPSAR